MPARTTKKAAKTKPAAKKAAQKKPAAKKKAAKKTPAAKKKPAAKKAAKKKPAAKKKAAKKKPAAKKKAAKKKPAAKKKAAKKKAAKKKAAKKKPAAKKKAGKKTPAAKTKTANQTPVAKKAAKAKPATKTQPAAKTKPAAKEATAKQEPVAPTELATPSAAQEPPEAAPLDAGTVEVAGALDDVEDADDLNVVCDECDEVFEDEGTEVYLGERLEEPERTVTPADVLAAARQAAASGDPTPYVRARDVYVAETHELLRPELVGHAESMRQLANKLHRQPNPGVPIHPLEAATVAVLLEPDSSAVRKTRGLIAMTALQADLALEDFARAVELGDPSAAGLLEYARLTFAHPGFCPIVFPDEPAPLGPGSAGCARGVDALRRQLQVYATRIHVLRARLREHGVEDGAPGLVPDPARLLPDGPLELRVERVEVEPGVVVEVDPTVRAEAALACLERARGDWAALTALLHLTGHSTLTLPDAITPRAGLVNAREWAEYAVWRAKNQELAGGADADARGFPDVAWRDGHGVRGLSPDLARLAAAEFGEVFAAVVWLTDPGCPSPFEDGLRV
ncbi:MAG: hypothetical protein R3F62_08785 [Planctomycetota bacterium]